MSGITHFLERLVFTNRKIVVGLFVLATAFLLFQASQMRLDAGFEKNIPLNHEYMQTYMEHRKDFGGANGIYVSVCDTSGNIYNTEFFDTLKNVHDQLFFINGVDRSLVVSLFAPSTRFTEIVEGGFSGALSFRQILILKIKKRWIKWQTMLKRPILLADRFPMIIAVRWSLPSYLNWTRKPVSR